MNSFFDVFKWDRFVAPSAMELLFWLVSVMILLGGVYGLVTGIGMAEQAPLPGLILIAVSVIGTLAGIIIARIICETVVILFRVNENLMDIAERSVSALPLLEPARLEHRAERRDRPVERAGRDSEPRPPIDLDAEDLFAEDAVADVAEVKPAEAKPAAPSSRPAADRVEPRAWDVKPADARPAEPRAAEPRAATRPVAPPVVIVDAEAEPAAPTPPRRERRPAASVPVPEETQPIITPPPRRPRPAAAAEPPAAAPQPSEPAIDHALRRLSNGTGVEAIRAANAAASRRSLAEKIEAEALDAAAEEDLEADDEDYAAYLDEEPVIEAPAPEPEPARRARPAGSAPLPRAQRDLARIVRSRLIPEATEPPAVIVPPPPQKRAEPKRTEAPRARSTEPTPAAPAADQRARPRDRAAAEVAPPAVAPRPAPSRPAQAETPAAAPPRQRRAAPAAEPVAEKPKPMRETKTVREAPAPVAPAPSPRPAASRAAKPAVEPARAASPAPREDAAARPAAAPAQTAPRAPSGEPPKGGAAPLRRRRTRPAEE